MLNQYLIKQGDTLGSIAQANKTDIATLQKFNPQITNPDLIYAGQNLNLSQVTQPTQTITQQSPTPVIASSELARNKYNENVNTTLPKLESQFIPPAPVEPTPVKVGESPIVQPKVPLDFKSSNLAYQNIIDQANKLITDAQESGVPLSPEIQQRINDINRLQFTKTSAIGEGRTAADEKDAAKVEKSITTANEADKTQQDNFNALMTELRTGRTDYMASLAPGEKEIQLQRDLQTLRTERQLEPLSLRMEGISALGIQGRQIDSERVRAILEQNLLFEIGLEQESREFRSAGIEKQINWISQDIELQQKITKKIEADEQRVIENARNLAKDSLTALSTIADKFSGLAWEDLDPQTQQDTLNLLKSYPDITISILSDVLKTSKNQQIFDNAIKAGKATGGKELLSPTEATSLGVPYGTTKSQAQGMGITPQKPATAAQQIVAGYAARMEQANPIIKSLEKTISGMSYLGYKAQSWLPSAFQSSEFQQYDQASRNLINAILRRESGAAISKSEFDNAYKQYLPQAGDGDETLKQKEINRNLVFANFKQGAGSAYVSVEDLLSGNSQQITAESEIYVDKNGIEYIKGEDGLYYPK